MKQDLRLRWGWGECDDSGDGCSIGLQKRFCVVFKCLRLLKKEHQMIPRRYCRWSRKGRGGRDEASEKQEFLYLGNTDRGFLIRTCCLILFSDKLVII
jgi:hypothetical protein